MLARFFSISLGAIVVAGCDGDFPPLTFTPQGTDTLIVEGVVDARGIDNFNAAMASNPNTRLLLFDFVPGSADDTSNLQLARTIRTLGLNTKIDADGLVFSGGTDLFLSGVMREIEAGACIGVHSWGDSSGSEVGVQLPRNHPYHQDYLDYYEAIGIDEAFYWFTLEAAGVDDWHWMSQGEIDRFNMATQPTTAETATQQCIERFDAKVDSLIEKYQ